MEAAQEELANQLSKLSASQVDMVALLAELLLRGDPEAGLHCSRSGFLSACIAKGAAGDARDMDAKLATLPDWVVQYQRSWPCITITQPRDIIALLADCQHTQFRRLPKECEALADLFESLEGHHQFLQQRKGGCPGNVALAELTKSFAEGDYRQFGKEALQTMLAVSPGVYECRWELRKGKHQLVVDLPASLSKR